MVHTALLSNPLKDNAVQCALCAHRCFIPNGEYGKCQVRFNRDGKLFTNAYGNLISQHVDPIEKKPLYHFFPGSFAYSIAIAGCNLECQWCQNWQISQPQISRLKTTSNFVSPDEVVKCALAQRCLSIAYTYTEPTIFFEYCYDVSKLAQKASIRNIFVSNGYMSLEMLELYHPWLDAANIDIKTFSDLTYKKYTGGHLRPVLESCKKLKSLGVWLEITTLVIPSINDDLGEMKDLALFIHDELGADTPWHLSRYFPSFNFQDIPPTPLKTLREIEGVAKEVGLNYVYIGNISQETLTKCPQCGEILIRRWGSQIVLNRITKQQTCPNCDFPIAGIGLFFE